MRILLIVFAAPFRALAFMMRWPLWWWHRGRRIAGDLTVYRLEHAEVQCGPYTAIEHLKDAGVYSLAYFALRRAWDVIDRQTPAQHLPRQYWWLGLPRPSRAFFAEPITPRLTRWRFGCRSLEQLATWFRDPVVVERLGRLDFVVAEYRVPAARCRATAVQVVFPPDCGRRVRTVPLRAAWPLVTDAAA